jgi:acyl-CoA thioester hydrolase
MSETTELNSHLADRTIEKSAYNAISANWFEYPITVHPHHTDFSGVVWHGTYITWLEAARVECLKSIGIEFADLVAAGCNLPVVEISLRYYQGLRMGETAIVKTRMKNLHGVRIKWEYELQSEDREITYLTGTITLVAVDQEKGKIMRQLPPVVKDALVKLW